MTTKTQTTSDSGYLVAGEQLHWLGKAMTARTGTAGLSGSGVLLVRGTTITLTQQFIDANKGWLRLLGDSEGQEEKYGELRFAPGPFPENLLTTVPGQRDHSEAREAARQAAWAIPEPGERRVALAEVDRVYGRHTTSTVIGSYRGGSR